MIYVDELLTALRELADRSEQTDHWLAPSYDLTALLGELACQIFDDTTLAIYFDKGRCPDELDEGSCAILRRLDEAISQIAADAPLSIDGPVMIELRSLAAEAVAAIESHLGRPSSEVSSE